MLRKILLSVCSLSLIYSVSYAQKRAFIDIEENIKPDEIIVKIKPSSPVQRGYGKMLDVSGSRLPFARDIKPATKKPVPDSSVLANIYRIQLEEGQDPLKVINTLKAYGNVVYAEPVVNDQPLHFPNDPLSDPSSGDQWYLEKIRAYDAWDITKSNSNIIIGISDTGIDFDHDDISPKIYHNAGEIINGVDDDLNGYVDDINGYDFADNDYLAQCATDFHGNRVAGLAGAATNNEIGMAGIGYHATISPLKVFRNIGNTGSGTYESIEYAADNGYDIINLSWGSKTYSHFAQDYIDYAVLEHDMVVIAAAGNENNEFKYYPASYNHALAVSWTDQNDNKAGNATYNYLVDMVAPGQGITSSHSSNSYVSDNGSSYAAPITSGAAALLIDAFPWLNAQQIMQLLRVTTDEIYSVGSNSTYEGKLGSGRLNIYNALTADSVRSVRVTDVDFSGIYPNHIFFDDTISVTADIISYLFPVRSGSVTISSPSPYASQLTGAIKSIGFTDSMESKTFNIGEFYLSPDTPPNTEIPIRLDFIEGSYQDFQYVLVNTSPDYIQFSNDQLTLTTAGNGDLGYPTIDLTGGQGFLKNNITIAEEISFAIGNSNEMVMDNLFQSITENTRDGDFETEKYIRLYEHEIADHYTYHEFSSSTALPLLIEQSNFAFAGAENKDFMILEYRIINNSPDSIKDIFAGLYLDWMLDDGVNRATFDGISGINYAFKADQSLYAGVKIYGESAPNHQSIDLTGYNENIPDITNHISDSIKFSWISTSELDNAGFEGDGNDISQMTATNSWSLSGYGDQKIGFIIATGTSVEDLRLQVQKAENKYEEILSHPPLEETVYSCNGEAVEINPIGGDLFRYYADPLGLDTLSEGASILISDLTKDSSLYLQSLDGLYPSAMGRIDIKVIVNPAQFQVDTDTLYLDQASANFVQFTDASLNPISWLWDFDNGTQSNIQNPKISYSTTGVYEVSLYVETEEGCTGTSYQDIVVATRPDAPQLSDTSVCAGSTVTVQNNNGDSLAVYLSTSSPTPFFEGPSFQWTNILSDSTLFFSRIKNQFKSIKTPLSVTVKQPKPNFEHLIDPNGNGKQILIVDRTEGLNDISWMIDGEARESTDTLQLTITKNSYDISLTATNETGCSEVLTKTITFSQSEMPAIQDQFVCFGESSVLKPSNGNSFGFYADKNLNELLHIGSEYITAALSEDATFYIVSFDDILPSSPVAVKITVSNPDITFIAEPETLYLDEGKEVTFSLQDTSIALQTWMVDGKVVGTQTPIKLFLPETGFYEVKLIATQSSGCIVTQTQNYLVAETEPLENKINFKDITLSPNPTFGSFRINGLDENFNIRVLDLAGREIYQLMKCRSGQKITPQITEKGIYVIHVETNEQNLIFRLLRK